MDGGGGCDVVVWPLLAVFIQSLILRAVGWLSLEHNIPGFMPSGGRAGTCRWLLRSLLTAGILGSLGGGYGQSLEGFSPV